MSHILAAILNPSAGDFITEPLVDLATRIGAQVTLLHILRSGTLVPSRVLEHDRQAVEQIRQVLCDRGITCEARVIESGEDISGTTLEAAHTVGATLLVVGIAGKSVFARTTRWGVPTELIQRTHIPILLIPPSQTRV